MSASGVIADGPSTDPALRLEPEGFAVRTAGTPLSGPAVVWIHGYTMDSSTWEELWALLPGWFHIGVDLLGHGQSAPTSTESTLPSIARSVARLAERYRATRVVALSFGSSIALQWALELPDSVTRLVVGAPTIAGVEPEPSAERRYKELMMLKRFTGPGEQMTELWMSSPPDIFRGTENHPRLRAALRDIILRHRWKELDDGAMGRMTAWRQTDADLAAISARTLAVIGEQDMPTFLASADRLAAVLPDCTTARIPDAGHLVLIERAAAVAPLLEAHLR